ncbi:MAG: multiubiquitin domain-containing protein [Betaproteobacteria bacterium]|nr:multiubiquitin domain-containing protein [Betaproteobacteria bacterium]
MQHAMNPDRAEPGHEGSGHQPPKSTTIIINGRPKEVAARELSFMEIVRLAFDDAVFNDVTIYTITFKRGHGDKSEGTLVEGESVKVKEGMIFNVARTDKS